MTFNDFSRDFVVFLFLDTFEYNKTITDGGVAPPTILLTIVMMSSNIKSLRISYLKPFCVDKQGGHRMTWKVSRNRKTTKSFVKQNRDAQGAPNDLESV